MKKDGSKFDKDKFISFFIKNGGLIISDKPIKGKHHADKVYFNWRTVFENVNNVDKCADFVIQFIQDSKIKADCFVGVPEGATKLGIILQYRWAKKFRKNFLLSQIRGRAKSYGDMKDREFLGIPKGKVILIEDVLAKGDAIKESLRRLKKVNIIPRAIIVLTDRSKKGSKQKLVKMLNNKKVQLYTLTNEREVMEVAKKMR